MPLLPKPRHEKFAQALAEGKSATEAYEIAGYTPNDGNTARMKGNDRVRERIAELQGQGAKRAVATLESLIAEARDIQSYSRGQILGCRFGAHREDHAGWIFDRSPSG